MRQIIKRWDNDKIIFETEADTLREAVEEAVREKASLAFANLLGVDLPSADLLGVDLQSADLWGAYLQDANLQDANLQSADLRGAYLQRANLWGANLQQANLQDANLQSIDLRGANVATTIITQLTIHNLYQINATKQGCRIGCKWKTWGGWDDVIKNEANEYIKYFSTKTNFKKQIKAYKLAKKMLGVR